MKDEEPLMRCTGTRPRAICQPALLFGVEIALKRDTDCARRYQCHARKEKHQ